MTETTLFTIAEARDALGGARLLGDGAAAVRRVVTDSRAIESGDLFVAIRGERFDANEFAPAALAAGAAAVLVDRVVPALSERQGPALVVADARVALGELGIAWRRRFAVPVIAVTGSNGKTTVKEMIASILASAFGRDGRLATLGNLNADIGVPMTVLRLTAAHRAAVIELGMNHPGEIAWLARIAGAGVALVNNAQREHQEFMASVEATAHENGAAIAALADDGVAVFPGDDPCAPIWRGLAGARRRLEFGLVGRADEAAQAGAAATADGLAVWAEATAADRGGAIPVQLGETRITVRLQTVGRHNLRNALAAAACCHAIGVPATAIIAGLEAFQPVKGRLVSATLAGGARLIDDSYNANPDSVRAAIDVLAMAARPTLLVLGDMGEVGEQGPAFHEEVGGYARERGVDRLFGFGDATRASVAAFGAGGTHFEALSDLIEAVRGALADTATVLVKGSRFMRMERVIEALQRDPATLAAGGH